MTLPRAPAPGGSSGMLRRVRVPRGCATSTLWGAKEMMLTNPLIKLPLILPRTFRPLPLAERLHQDYQSISHTFPPSWCVSKMANGYGAGAPSLSHDPSRFDPRRTLTSHCTILSNCGPTGSYHDMTATAKYRWRRNTPLSYCYPTKPHHSLGPGSLPSSSLYSLLNNSHPPLYLCTYYSVT